MMKLGNKRKMLRCQKIATRTTARFFGTTH